MATKNIAITEDAYDLLRRYKRPGESFSEVIRNFFGKKRRLSNYCGIWESLPESAFEELENNINKARKGINSSLDKRIEGNK